MFRSLIIILFSLVIFKNVEAKVGKGELKLSERTMIHFIEYLYGSNDKYSLTSSLGHALLNNVRIVSSFSLSLQLHELINGLLLQLIENW